jgi:DsbC/DsbD-like thiol-disulfide interchange protein
LSVPVFVLLCDLLLGASAALAQGATPVPRPVLAQVEAVAVGGSLAVGETVDLVVRVTPKPGVNIYAPGEKRYKPVRLIVDRADGIRAGKPAFPRSAWSTFEGERVRVYRDAFEIRQPVRVTARPTGPVVISGTLEYQACDDLMCYLPVKVPLRWDVPVR